MYKNVFVMFNIMTMVNLHANLATTHGFNYKMLYSLVMNALSMQIIALAVILQILIEH